MLVLVGASVGLVVLWGFYFVRMLKMVSEGKLPWEASLLVVLLFTGAIAAGGFSMMQVWYVQRLRSNQARMININRTRVLVQNLLGDIAEYRKTHPNIDPILQSLNLLTTNTVPNPAPAGSTMPGAPRPAAK